MHNIFVAAKQRLETAKMATRENVMDSLKPAFILNNRDRQSDSYGILKMRNLKEPTFGSITLALAKLKYKVMVDKSKSKNPSVTYTNGKGGFEDGGVTFTIREEEDGDYSLFFDQQMPLS